MRRAPGEKERMDFGIAATLAERARDKCSWVASDKWLRQLDCKTAFFFLHLLLRISTRSAEINRLIGSQEVF